MKRRMLAFVLVLCLLLSMLPSYAALGRDVYGHWAQEYIAYLNDRGIMEGYPDGTFKPDAPITKAEFITLINRAFGLSKTTYINYSDVSTSKWYYNEIAKAKASDYMFTFSQQVRPDKNLIREEAAAMFGRLLGLTSSAAVPFDDRSAISTYAASYITAVAEAGIINGYPDGTFKPKNEITRAEVAKVLCTTVGSYYNQAGSFLSSVEDNATIVTSGVTLRNMTIPGDLYITEGVGSGTVTLDNVIVGGKIVTVGAPTCTLNLMGVNTSAELAVKNTAVKILSPITRLVVSGQNAVSIAIADSASIGHLTLNGTASITGNGTVTNAEINVSGSSFAARPLQYTLKAGTYVTIAGVYTTTSGAATSTDFVTGYPTATASVNTYGMTNIEVKAKLTKASNLYYIAVASGSAAPTAAQIIAGQNYGNAIVYKSNRAQVFTANSEVIVSIVNLPSGMSYDVWVVCEDLFSSAAGTPVKVTPTAPIFAADPTVQSASGNQALISVKASRNTVLYWAAVPKNVTSIPTASQIIAQTGTSSVYGMIFGSKQLTANTADTVAISNLYLGAASYDLYFVTKDMAGTILPSTPLKVSLTNTVTTMSVTLNGNAVNGEYPTYTTVTLSFAKDMYKKDTALAMSFLDMGSSSIKSYLKITQLNLATGKTTEVSDYKVHITSNKQLTIVPVTGWDLNSKYTIEVLNLTSADGTAPTPSSTSFTTSGASSIIAPPVASVAGDTSVQPGSTITLTTTVKNAVIQYSLDGNMDPSSPPYVTGAGSGTTVTIPAERPAGTQVILTAVTRTADNKYSSPVKYTYVIGYGAVAPQFKTVDGNILSDGVEMMAGSRVYLTCSDTSAMIYYTTDGSAPSISSPHVSAVSAHPITVQGAVGDVMVIKAQAISGDGSLTTGGAVTLRIRIVASASSTKPLSPSFFINYEGLSSGQSGLHFDRGSVITISPVGNAGNVRICYTTDGTDPTNSPTRQIVQNGAATVLLFQYNVGGPYKIRAVTCSGESWNPVYSNEAYLTFTIS